MTVTIVNRQTACTGFRLLWAVLALALAANALGSERYTQRTGLASWYGMESAGRAMANGAPFDPEKLTAASWDFPLGSSITVTNAQNGKSVTVVVTDRGPNERLVALGRIVDLSHAAFAAIAETRLGIIEVRVRLASPARG